MMNDKLGNDIQKSVPSTQISLSHVGVTGLKRILRLGDGSGRDMLFSAELELYAHLDAKQSGVHMSRFIENIEKAASEIAYLSSPDFETLTDRMALAIARTQGAARAEARVRAQYPMKKRTPESDMEVENLYTFIGISASDGESIKRAAGVEVNGLTVCPCAKEMVTERARGVLLEAGYSESQATEILTILPMPSHNQRGLGTLLVGSAEPVRVEKLVSIVEDSMSSGIYELLKRPDELKVVWDGHLKPRFVEDVVREMIRGVNESLSELEDEAFVLARQENFESIHVHNAYAERCGLLGDIRRELRGETSGIIAPASIETWLDAGLSRSNK
jgi:GTP cyclohydrolase-4